MKIEAGRKAFLRKPLKMKWLGSEFCLRGKAVSA
jgi:hypothetical protein